LAGPRRFAGFAPVHLLALAAIAEVGVYRVLVGALEVHVKDGQPPPPPAPTWHVVVGWVGVFLHYFVGALAIGILAVRAARTGKSEASALRSRPREYAIGGAAAVVAALSALALVVGEGATTAFLLESGVALAALIAFWVAVPGLAELRRGGLTPRLTAFGLAALMAPLLIHYYGVIGSRWLWPDEAGDRTGPIGGVLRTGLTALCAAAIVSPYCFGPRPFVRSVVRIPPVIVAMAVAAGLAFVARRYWAESVSVVEHAVGIKLDPEHPERDTALYILSFATLAWTLTSCAIAETAPRRQIGLGLGLVILGGYHDVIWPAYYAMITVGLFTIVDAVPEVYDAEQAEVKIKPTTPAVDDRIWQEWVTTLVGALRAAGHKVNALTARGEDDHMSTVITGELARRSMRVRIDRIAGCVLVIDTRFGREMGDDTPPTFSIEAKPETLRRNESHPEPPMTAPRFELGELGFDGRFKSRGSQRALVETLDDGLRPRLTAVMDGWLAVWAGASVRHRVYPGRAAPVDQPIPLSDLALMRAGPESAARMVTLLGLLAEVAVKVLPEPPPEPEAEASEPAAPPPEPEEPS